MQAISREELRRCLFSRRSWVFFIGALLLSLVTGFLGSVGFYTLRWFFKEQRTLYWLVLLPVAAFFYKTELWSALIFSNLLIGGIYAERRMLGDSRLKGAYISWVVTAFSCAALFTAFMFFNSYTFTEVYTLMMNWLKAHPFWDTLFSKVDEKSFIDIFIQLPGHVGIFLAMQICAIFYVEKNILRFYEVKRSFENFNMYKTPAWCVWGLAASVGLLILRDKSIYLRALSYNGLIIFLGLYFFQGMAVINCVYEHFQVKKWARFLLNIFIILNLVILVSLTGVVDYWLDIRKKLKDMKQEPKEEL